MINIIRNKNNCQFVNFSKTKKSKNITVQCRVTFERKYGGGKCNQRDTRVLSMYPWASHIGCVTP